jgi:hypothetical protein
MSSRDARFVPRACPRGKTPFPWSCPREDGSIPWLSPREDGFVPWLSSMKDGPQGFFGPLNLGLSNMQYKYKNSEQ